MGILGAGVILLLAVMSACGAFRQEAKTALDVVQAVCVVAHADLAPEQVKDTCNVVDTLLPAMRDLIAITRQKEATAAAYALGRAGCPAPGR